MDFGTRLKELRKQNGLTQQQLAESVGVTKSVISFYELKERAPSPDVLTKLSYIFHVSTDYLLGIERNKTVDVTGLSDEDIYARYDQYQDETDTLMDRLEELDKKAGWIDNEEYEYSEDECNALYDTGKLTAEEAEQLQKAYERIEEIDAEVWTDDDLSDDEIEARYAKYDDEITSLNAQIETLEKKAGWYEGYYGNLSEDEVNQLNSIYNKIDAIYDNIYNGSDNLSDEEFASRYAKYSDEIDALEAQAIALEAKAGGTKIQTY